MKTTSQLKRANTIAVSGAAMLLAMLGAQLRPALAQQEPDTLAAREAKQDWTRAELTLDNSGYAATRAQIDRLVRQGQKPDTLVFYSRLRGKDIYDPQKIFRWAYASYKKQKVNPNQNVLSGVEEVMNHNLRPGAYDWVRLRFLIASLQMFQRPTMQLIGVGRRLLNEKRNDEEVTYHFIRNLKDSESLTDTREAVSLARANSRRHPRDVYWQWLVADTVSAVNDYAGIPTYKGSQDTIAEYKKTLRLLPPGHPYRQRLIDGIVRLQILYDANGKKKVWTMEAYKAALRTTNLR